MTFQGYNISTQTYPPTEPAGLPAFGSTPFVLDRTSDTIELTWNTPTAMVPTDYVVEYQTGGVGSWTTFSDGVSTDTTTTITGLTQLTAYHIRVRAINATTFTAWSNTIMTSTVVSNVFFDTAYSYFNVAGVSPILVAAYENATVIEQNGVVVATLQRGEVTSLTSTTGDVFASDGKFTATGTAAASMVALPSRVSAGSVFSLVSTRNDPQTVYYRAFQAGTIELQAGGTVLDSAVITDGATGTLSANFFGNMQLVSTGLVVCYFTSNGFVDAQLMVPDSDSIIGVPSSSGRVITTSSSSVGVNLVHSNSTVETAVVSSASSVTVSPQGTTSQYQTEAVWLSTPDGETIGGASFADSDGTAAARFQPTTLMKTEFIITMASDWVAFASLDAGSIDILNSSDVSIGTITLNRSGAATNAPYKGYSNTSYPAGTRFKATVPVAAWWEEPGADDETVLLGLD